MMKKIHKVLVIIVVLFLAAGIFKDQIIKSVVTVAATQIVGAPVHIAGFSLGVFKPSVKISGFRIYNPKGFSKGILIDLSKINVIYDLGALLKRRIHLVSIEIKLKEMGLEKNRQGKLNVDALKVAKQDKDQQVKLAKPMPLQLDIVKLGIGRIVLKDFSAGSEPVVKVYDINIDKSFKNITSAQQLAALILAEPMKAAGIQGAAIYGAAMLAGVAVLPVTVVATFMGKDSVMQDFSSDFDSVYGTSLVILKKMGQVTKEDATAGMLNVKISDTQVVVRIMKKSNNTTGVVISARKYFLPKPEIAAGVLYEISEKLK